MRIGVVAAVFMVLRRDLCECVGLIAIFLEILLRDPPEHAGKTAFNRRVFLQVAGLHQDVADFRTDRIGHLFDTDDEHQAATFRVEEIDALMDRGGTRRAGIFDTRRRLVTQCGIGLKDQRSAEILLRETAVVEPKVDRIDIRRCDAGIGNSIGRDADDQRFYIFASSLPNFE